MDREAPSAPAAPRVERILCAAVWVDDGVERVFLPRNISTGIVFAGWRHHNCIAQAGAFFPKGSVDEEQRRGKNQGFLTSLGTSSIGTRRVGLPSRPGRWTGLDCT